MKIPTKLPIRSIAFALSFLISQTSSANSVQFFNPASYQNPARMNTTQDTHLLTGAMFTNVYGRFSGKILGNYSTIKTNHTLLFPYIMFAHRLNDRVVCGMDVYNPILGYISWPVNGFQQNFGIDANLLSFEVAPKISIRLTEKFAIGGTLRYFSLWRTELNYAVQGSYMINKGIGDNWGGTIGIWYMYNPKNFADLSYFTPIKVTLRGTSASGLLVDRSFKFLPFTYSPGTIVLNLTHIFTDKFLAAAKICYSFWNVCKALTLQNVVLGPRTTSFILNWKNTVMANIFTRYQTSQKTAFMTLVGYDQSLVRSSNNVVAFPIGDLFYAGIGGEYRFHEKAVLSLFATQGRVWRPKIHNPPGLVDGVSLPRYTVIDLSSTFDF